MSDAIPIRMDTAGRLVIPKDIRRRAGWHAGLPLEVDLVDGVVRIRPRPRDVVVEDSDGLRVARPVEPSDALGIETVERTRSDVRRGRTTR